MRGVIVGLIIMIPIYMAAFKAWPAAQRGELGIALHAGDR